MDRRSNSRCPEEGFTLIELLVVVAIIGILAAIAIPNYVGALDRGRQTATAAQIRAIGAAVQAYAGDNQRFPVAANIDDLKLQLREYDSSLQVQDKWHNDMTYDTNVEASSYSIESFGKDGIPGANVTPETRRIFTLDILYTDGSFDGGIE